MPTEAEAEELLRCKWEEVVINDVNGYKVTGVNGNSIFIPKAGYISEEKFITKDRDSWLWTSTPTSSLRSNAYCIESDSYYTTGDFRMHGIPVRPVIDACGSIEVKNVLEGADVYINGTFVSTLWKSPFRTDITDYLNGESIDIEIRVTNLWVNRLIRDSGSGTIENRSYTSKSFYTPEDELMPSGLVGEITLHSLL